MERPYWHKQTADKPLFPDLLWSRPENASFAGKLLIVGGNLYGFNNPAKAYEESKKAGIGVARVLLPDALQKTFSAVTRAMQADAAQEDREKRPEPYIKYGEDASQQDAAVMRRQHRESSSSARSSSGVVHEVVWEYAPSTPSGSFSQRALGELLPMAAWADAVLLSGDLGRNSETAILLEKLADKYSGQLTITCDAADYFINSPSILDRQETLWVISVAQLQKLAMNARFTTAFTYDMDILRFVEALHEFTLEHPGLIIVKHLENIFVAAEGQVSSTKLEAELPIWRLKTAAHAAVWRLQNPGKPYESLTTSLISQKAAI